MYANMNEVTTDEEYEGNHNDVQISTSNSLNTCQSDQNEKKSYENANTIQNKKRLLYGNDIEILEPSKIGNTFSYIYINNSPCITLGPQCK